MITLWQTKKLLKKKHKVKTREFSEALRQHVEQADYYKRLLRFYMRGRAWGYGKDFWYKAKESYLFHRDRCDEIKNAGMY